MTIDIHAHYVPMQLIARVREKGAPGVSVIDTATTPAFGFEYGFNVRPLFPQLTESAQKRIAWLDSEGIDYQLVATWPDMYGNGLPNDKCVLWHQLLNDTLIAWCVDHASRFGCIASVPLPDPEAAAAELARAIGLGAKGVMLPANVEGVNIGDLALDPLWAAAYRSNCPIIIHPVLTGPAPRANKFGLAQSTQYTFDTTLAAGSLLFSGILDRFPDLTIVLSHGGGAFPYLAGRFDIMHARMDRRAQGNVAVRTPSEYARRFAYDSILHAGRSLRLLADLSGIERIMLGTDYSFPPADLSPTTTLRDAGFSMQEIEQIAEHTPRQMFRLT